MDTIDVAKEGGVALNSRRTACNPFENSSFLSCIANVAVHHRGPHKPLDADADAEHLRVFRDKVCFDFCHGAAVRGPKHPTTRRRRRDGGDEGVASPWHRRDIAVVSISLTRDLQKCTPRPYNNWSWNVRTFHDHLSDRRSGHRRDLRHCNISPHPAKSHRLVTSSHHTASPSHHRRITT